MVLYVSLYEENVGWKRGVSKEGGGQVSLFISLGQLQANMAKTGKSWILEEKLKID